MFTFLDLRHVLVPAAAAVTTKHRENVTVISRNNNLLYLTPTGNQRNSQSNSVFYLSMVLYVIMKNLEALKGLCAVYKLSLSLTNTHVTAAKQL